MISRFTILSIALVAFHSSAHSALIGRLPSTPSGTDYQTYYDTALDITWLADANYARISGYSLNGLMNWDQAQSWIGTLNTANYLGVSNWRLPTVIDTGTPGCDFAYTGTDCGFNVDLGTSEMAHMYYSTLGNAGFYDAFGLRTDCFYASFCLTNIGPFSNLQRDIYWSGTEYAPATDQAWDFYFYAGYQDHTTKSSPSSRGYAWAVRSGDIGAQSVVPIPAAAYLLGGALGLLGVVRRRSAARASR